MNALARGRVLPRGSHEPVCNLLHFLRDWRSLRWCSEMAVRAHGDRSGVQVPTGVPGSQPLEVQAVKSGTLWTAMGNWAVVLRFGTAEGGRS